MIKKTGIALLVLGLLVAGYLSARLFRPAVHNPDNRYFYVHATDDPASIKERLVYQQFISGKGYDLAIRVLKFKTVKPGRYLLKDGMSVMKLVRKLRAGDQEPVKLVIVKERTKELFAGKMGKKFDLACDSLQMITFLKSNDSLRNFGVDTNTVLSIVMPFTYEVNWNSSPAKIISLFHDAWEKFWKPDRKEKAAKLNLTPVQVSILASIVEEETNRKADRYNIASVYLNRLKKDMRLEADPTVKYVTRNFNLGRIQGTHLKLESPYNTYQNKGLPPGPICTPSVEAIDCVLDAPKTEYIFFVASHKFDGSTVFTTNYDDHRKFVRLFHAEQTRRADSIKKMKAAGNVPSR